jgi:hypothetical protein
MNKEASSIKQELAIPGSSEHQCDDAPDYIKRFCQVWGEVGRAILGRRNIVTA